MISPGLNNINLYFATIFIVAVSATGMKTRCTNPTRIDKDQNMIVVQNDFDDKDDTAFIVKAIKFHQQQIMLSDIADKKLTDTSLKRVVAQIRTNHQTSLGELFKIYRGKDSTKVAGRDKQEGDSIIADRTKELPNEGLQFENMKEKDFQDKWIQMMVRNYDQMIPEYEKEVELQQTDSLKVMTAKAMSKIKDNRTELKQWKSTGKLIK